MLICCWSPKGGSGTSVFAAACALVAAREHRSVRLVDVDGDQESIFALTAEPATGVREWLQVGIDAPVDALDRLTVPIGSSLSLLPSGRADVTGAAPEVGAALGMALRESPGPTIVDLGVPRAAWAHGLLAVADAAVVVVRPCYLALRRAVRIPATREALGAVLVDDPGRALASRDIADVLGLPVLATVPVRAPVARVVDAGVFATRLPDAIAKPARAALARVNASGREGRAA